MSVGSGTNGTITVIKDLEYENRFLVKVPIVDGNSEWTLDVLLTSFRTN